MSEILLILSFLVPMLLACFVHRLESRWWLLSAAMPALYLGLMGEQGSAISLPWVMLGVNFELDATAQLFLIFTSLIWMLAALTIPQRDLMPGATGYRKQSFLLAMAGNMLLVTAADMLSFYVGFALMGLSAYGLLWGASQRARRAARIYLVFTLIGELALFSALLLMMVNSDSLLFAELHAEPLPEVALLLLLLGFGIKVAIPGLHLWLPRAYTLAPLFGVVVLSGPMMKAGLLGWLRFLPFGESLDPLWGDLLLLLGVIGVVLGMLLGVVQRQPRSVLAYSSIAKMGMFSALIGFLLNHPDMVAAVLPVIVLMALHHLMVKPMLFVGLDLWQKGVSVYLMLPALGLLSLSLVAFPLTGGGASKHLLSAALNGDLAWLLLLAGIAAVLLIWRFLSLLQIGKFIEQTDSVTLIAWFALLPVAVWAPFVWDGISFEVKALLPLMLGAGLILMGLFLRRWFALLQQSADLRLQRMIPRFPQLHLDSLELRAGLPLQWHPLKQTLQPQRSDQRRQLTWSLQDSAIWWLMLILALLLALTLSN
jgi:formate hydrogenlyase subunit 3/multisubunit Na+/H+ antiporter MnhD subunit